MEQKILLKRAYDPSSESDGYRVYVDRLWPRGLSKENFHYDEWAKNIAPSTELRKWFHENPAAEWQEFEQKYREELTDNPDFSILKNEIKSKPVVTILYSSHDTIHNNSIVIRDMLMNNPG